MEIKIEKGFIRDFGGVWHPLVNVLRLYVKTEQGGDEWYSQVLMHVNEPPYYMSSKFVVEITDNVKGKETAQDILDTVFTSKYGYVDNG